MANELQPMSASINSEEIDQLPAKPKNAFLNGLKHAAIAASSWAAFVAVATLAGRIFPSKTIRDASRKADILKDIPYQAAFGGAVGAVHGYMQGVREQAEYPLKMEKFELQNRLAKYEPRESFTQTALDEKLDNAEKSQAK